MRNGFKEELTTNILIAKKVHSQFLVVNNQTSNQRYFMSSLYMQSNSKYSFIEDVEYAMRCSMA